MNYCVRITGPGIDHQALITDLGDFDMLDAIIAKMRKYVAYGRVFPEPTPIDGEVKP
jgi:hypothetical protein